MVEKLEVSNLRVSGVVLSLLSGMKLLFSLIVLNIFTLSLN